MACSAILGASYGPRDVTGDFEPPLVAELLITFYVSDIVKSRVLDNSLQINAGDALFSNSWINVRKSCTIVYWSGSIPKVCVVAEGTEVQISDLHMYFDPVHRGSSKLRIYGAAYGISDVSGQ